jgi:hypothetical protein
LIGTRKSNIGDGPSYIYKGKRSGKPILFFTITLLLLFLSLITTTTTSTTTTATSVQSPMSYYSPTLPEANAQVSGTTNPNYVYDPYLTLSGSNFQDIASSGGSGSLQLSRFTVAAWFNTPAGINFGSNTFIVNKGGDGSESSGKNMNYGIWMTSSETIQAGFEIRSGANYYATSTNKYNDGKWHYAVATYDGRYVRLYVDGIQVASKSATNRSPDNTGIQPLRIGANSLASPANGYFTGNADEIRVWNRALTLQEVTDAYSKGTFNPNGQVVYLSFDTIPPTIASKSPNTDESNVDISKPVTIVFSERMDSSTINTNNIKIFEHKTLDGTTPSTTLNDVTNSVTLDTADKKTVTASALGGLKYSTAYTVRISTAVKDLAGNQMVSPMEWSFGTQADTTPPTISSTNPTTEATGVTVTSPSISITFSELVDSLTVTSNTFTLKNTATNTNISGTISTTTNTQDGKTSIATFIPSQNLAYSTRYTATITTGIEDLAGNPIASDYSWSFSTQSETSPPPPPPPSSDVDTFGIKKLYPTKTGGEEWYMNMQNPTGDPRFNPKDTITTNPDGSWKMRSTQVRMNVYTSTGYDQSKIATYNQQQLESKGYMQAPNDWKNVEMTGYVKVNAFNTDDDYAWYNRGGRHTDTAPCEGTAYKGGLTFSGKSRFAKEQWHVSYVFTPYRTVTDSIKGEWIGFKYIVYNIQQQDGNPAVKMENWVDINNDGTWSKIYENIDSGGWGSEATTCNGAPDQLITWGGPIATFRWDSATDIDFKHLSVREIQPP